MKSDCNYVIIINKKSLLRQTGGGLLVNGQPSLPFRLIHKINRPGLEDYRAVISFCY